MDYKVFIYYSNHLISWIQSTNMVIVFPNQEIQVYSLLYIPYLEVSLNFCKVDKYLFNSGYFFVALRLIRSSNSNWQKSTSTQKFP